MTQKVFAVVGVSGVGKSFLLTEFWQRFRFQHLQASDLIRQEPSGCGAKPRGGDELRLADIDENQVKLVSGFRRRRDWSAPCVVLDGHTVIDTPSGLVKVSPSVFREIGISHLVMLADDPAVIGERRAGDKERQRPNRSNSEIEAYQAAVHAHGFNIALALGIPYSTYLPDHLEALEKTLFR